MLLIRKLRRRDTDLSTVTKVMKLVKQQSQMRATPFHPKRVSCKHMVEEEGARSSHQLSLTAYITMSLT